MPKGWCLIQEKADLLLTKLKSGELTYGGLRKMESQNRLAKFQEFMSEPDAKRANLLFEQKLVQKDFFAGMDAWKATLVGKKSKKAEAISQAIAKRKEESLKRIFSPKENQAFLSELAEKKVGVGLSREEAEVIFRLSKEVSNGENAFSKKYIKGVIEAASGTKLGAEDAKLVESVFSKLEEAEITGRTKKFLASNAWRDLRRVMEDGIPPETKAQVNAEIEKVLAARKNGKYGESMAQLETIIGKLKLEAEGTYKGDLELLKENRGVNEVMALTKRGIIDSFSLMKAMKGSFDASAIGRQGLSVLTSGHYKEWLNLVVNQVKILNKSKGVLKFDNSDTLKLIRSEINNRPSARLGLYNRMKLAIGGREEQFQSTIADKIPLIRESSEMFTGSIWIARAELADKFYVQMLKDWKDLGVDMLDPKNSKQLDEELVRLGRRVNSMTGRGDIGLGKLGSVTQAVFWSPKFVQSNLDKLTGHMFDKEMMKSKVQKKRLAQEWVSRLGVTVGAMAVGAMVFGEDGVETDTTSSKFGTIKGIDVTGGVGGFITLFSRIGHAAIAGVTGGETAFKSASTGIKQPLSGFSEGVTSILSDFISGKSSPGARFLLDMANGANFDGQSMVLDKENPMRTAWIYAKGTVVPIPVENIAEWAMKPNDDDSQKKTAFIVANMFDLGGFSNKNGIYIMSWEQKKSKEMLQFKEKVGTSQFLKANEEFASEMNKNIPLLVQDERFKKLDEKGKKSKIDALNRKTKDKIFEKYEFEYEQEEISDEMEMSAEEVDLAIGELIGQ